MSESRAHDAVARRSAARARIRMAALAVAIAGCGAQSPVSGPADAGTAVPPIAEPGSDAAIAAAQAQPRAAKASPFEDSGAVTRLGLYASADEAARVLASKPGGALRVKVDRGGDEAAALAVNLVWGEQAAADLPKAVPVFVTGDDLRLAATVVDRLQDGGLTRVYLVGPRAPAR